MTLKKFNLILIICSFFAISTSHAKFTKAGSDKTLFVMKQENNFCVFKKSENKINLLTPNSIKKAELRKSLSSQKYIYCILISSGVYAASFATLGFLPQIATFASSISIVPSASSSTSSASEVSSSSLSYASATSSYPTVYFSAASSNPISDPDNIVSNPLEGLSAINVQMASAPLIALDATLTSSTSSNALSFLSFGIGERIIRGKRLNKLLSEKTFKIRSSVFDKFLGKISVAKTTEQECLPLNNDL